MALRSAAQLTRKPSQYRDHMQEERRRILSALLRELEQARRRGEPWYQWIELRHRGEHRHDLTDDAGGRIACPVGGCDAVRGAEQPHLPHGGRSRRASPQRSSAA